MNKYKDTIVVGLTGGIASGKSAVLHEFSKLGAKVIDADKISREISAPGSPVWKRIVKIFGNDILLHDSTIDRKKLAEIIFKNASKRKILEKITHPAIIEKINNLTASLARGAKQKVIMVDIPLLYEKKLDKLFDKVIVVWVPQKMQISRLRRRDGLTHSQIRSRMKAQLPLSIKRSRADIVIDNSAGIATVRKQVRKIWGGLTKSYISV